MRSFTSAHAKTLSRIPSSRQGMYAASAEEASTQKSRNPRAGSKLSRLQQQQPRTEKINLMKPQPTNTSEPREPTKNHQILLSSRPSGEPSLDNFQLAETEIPKPGPGQILLRTIYLSLDPYMRGRMNAGPSYARPGEIGKVMSGQSVCEVV